MKLIQQSFTASRNSIWKRSFIYTFFLVVVLLMACDQQPETTFGKPGDKFVETLLAKMTLEEKIGQLNLVASSDFVTGDFEETDIAKITTAMMLMYRDDLLIS